MKRVLGLALLAAVCSIAVAFLPSATSGASGPSVYAFVYATNPGPVRACAGPDPTTCPLNTVVQFFIYVANANRPANWLRGAISRPEIPNAYVVNSVEWKTFVNGTLVPEFAATFTPPPAANPPAFAGRWPATVTAPCPPGDPPCNAITNPAVLPGENTAAFVSRWLHGTDEPDGSYVFTFTVHGTLNGAPVNITANSRPIVMTH